MEGRGAQDSCASVLLISSLTEVFETKMDMLGRCMERSLNKSWMVFFNRDCVVSIRCFSFVKVELENFTVGELCEFEDFEM